MNNAISWARQYIAVPDAMYREYVEELLRMAEGRDRYWYALKRIASIKLTGYGKNWSEISEAKAIAYEAIEGNTIAGDWNVGPYAMPILVQNCPDCGRPAGPYLCTCKITTLKSAAKLIDAVEVGFGVDADSPLYQDALAAIRQLRDVIKHPGAAR